MQVGCNTMQDGIIKSIFLFAEQFVYDSQEQMFSCLLVRVKFFTIYPDQQDKVAN